jgi:hypothetical protein
MSSPIMRLSLAFRVRNSIGAASSYSIRERCV